MDAEATIIVMCNATMSLVSLSRQRAKKEINFFINMATGNQT